MLRGALLWLLIVGMGLTVIAFSYHGFRSESEDNPALGIFKYQYHWWKPRKVFLDSNRDGSINFYGILVRGATDFGDPFTEHWDDRNFDGQFEIHAVYSGDRLSVVELDDDHDGIYDRQLTGHEAEHFYDQFIDNEKGQTKQE